MMYISLEEKIFQHKRFIEGGVGEGKGGKRRRLGVEGEGDEGMNRGVESSTISSMNFSILGSN